MKRSYIALAVVIIASAIALFIHLQPPDQAVVQPADRKAVEPPTAPDKAKAVVPPTPPDKKAPEPKVEPKAKAEPKGKAETPEPPAPADTAAVLEAVDAHLAARKPVEAMKALSDAIAKTTGPAAAPLKKRQTELVNVHYFSSRPSPVATTYTVAAGDNLRRIAANHNATDSYVARLNDIKDKDHIRIGQRLKIVQGGFDAEIVKSQYLLTVTKDGIWIRDIKVGLGKDGATPIGAFIAGPKITEPPYTAVHPPIPFGDKKNNPLGTRWITIQGAGSNEYGIHGTWEDDSIGSEKSKGCIRMLNKDVEWLFDLIIPGKSKIVIKP